jgi:integrase
MGLVFGDDAKIFPCCTTLVMGFKSAVFLAQRVHEYQAECAGLDPADRITKDSDFRLDRPRHFIYVDDLIYVCLENDVDKVVRAQDATTSHMQALGLPHKPTKRQRPSCDGVVCVGVELHGKEGTAGVRPSDLAVLADETRAALSRATCRGRDMQRLVGKWGWAFQARRCTYSVFSAVYRFCETARDSVFEIWPSVRRELEMAVALAPLLFTRFTSPWHTTMVATDASEAGAGVVATQVQQTALSSMAHAPSPSAVDGPACRDVPRDFESARWAVIVASKWKFEEHINVLELRAFVTAVQWLLSRPGARATRLLLWADSTVVVGAVRKGRSSKFLLLRLLRSLTATLLAHDAQVFVNWVPTEKNPADAPSRRFEFDSTLGFPGEGPSFLMAHAMAPSTRVKYLRSVRRFLLFLGSVGWDPASPVELDEALVEFFHSLFVEMGGKCRSVAECALAGIHMLLPRLKGKMPTAALCLRGWRRLVPPVPHPPLSWEMAVAIAVRLVTRGRFDLGVGVLLAFDCYLRAGELFRLRARDVVLPGDRRVGSVFGGAGLRLATTKTGAEQFVEVERPVVINLLSGLVNSAVSPDSLLFSGSESSCRSAFREAAVVLGLPATVTLHSLRHGGATSDHLGLRPLEEILHRGRWASMKSARHYIQMGKALLVAATVPGWALDLGSALSADVLGAFALAQGH